MSTSPLRYPTVRHLPCLPSLCRGQKCNIPTLSNVCRLSQSVVSGSVGEAALDVCAEGPEEVPFEKTAAREFAAPLRLAGTYVVHASLGGIGLTGEPLCFRIGRAHPLLKGSLDAVLQAHAVCLLS